MGGDFNLPCDDVIPLLDNIMDLEVILLNDETPTYFEPECGYYFTLDLTFCSSELALQSRWRISLNPWGSNHFPIFFNIELNVSIRCYRKSSRPYSSTLFQYRLRAFLKYSQF